ncbi:unnamed protein product [Schistocephalus solidus]|uniref:Reverse transcriptase domain-containing protein n=1 Tax=Schistocephalus solidus TaxID=70667 RepID=A0A183SGW0_SCHSO|nr:unnamed protein product [Schistocephalus solidus]
MQNFSCPERFTHMVRQLHNTMMALVFDNGTVSEAFAFTSGVKQGCILAPNLFSLMFSAMMIDAYCYAHPGIRIAYRTSGHLLNSRRMQDTTRMSTTTVHELFFTGDCALNTVMEEDMQRRRSVKTVSAIYQVNWITAFMAKMAARMSQAPWINTANAKALSTCPSTRESS